eukprot:116422_1
MAEGYEETNHYPQTAGSGPHYENDFDTITITEQLPQYSDVAPSAPCLDEAHEGFASDPAPNQIPLQIQTDFGLHALNNTVEEELPLKSKNVGCCKGCSESAHCKSFCLTFGTLVCFVLAGEDAGTSSYEHEGNPLFYIGAAICYLLYVIEWCASSSRRYLSNIHDQESVSLIIKKTHQSPPHIAWRVQCYHYETRTYYETVTDSDGNTRSELRTEQVRVNTHSACTTFDFVSWADVSEPWVSTTDYKLTKVTCAKAYCFANERTRNDYDTSLLTFKRMNHKDSYQDFTETFTVAGLKTKLLAELGPGMQPCCLNSCWFCCWSTCLCSYCYRVWFSSIVGKKKYVFVKQISSI